MDTILIFDFGSQYTLLIAKQLRKLHTYSIIKYIDVSAPVDGIDSYLNNLTNDTNIKIKGVILSGGPGDIFPITSNFIFNNKFFKDKPILGICLGAQILASQYEGSILLKQTSEYGSTPISILEKESLLLKDLPDKFNVWMSHSNSISFNNQKLVTIKGIDNSDIGFEKNNRYGLLFHPEVTNTQNGSLIFNNFINHICKCNLLWKPDNILKIKLNYIKETINAGDNDSKILMAVSGGVDSSVAAMLINQVFPERLHCVIIDNGLLRKNEIKNIMDIYQKLNLNIEVLESCQTFYSNLESVIEPEKKRKIIGSTFIQEFQKYIDSKIKSFNPNSKHFLGQGTIYPDVIESKHIKSHHNVGGLPQDMKLSLIEPLRDLFKDDVRLLGKQIGIPDEIIMRHPFPGPGLAIRIMGEITPPKILILQQADNIFIQRLKNNNLYDKIWQAGTILLNTKTVGVMGDERTYQYTIALRAVNSIDGMTATCYRFDMEFIESISNEIINKVEGVNRVVYDLTSKPPGTIEWE